MPSQGPRLPSSPLTHTHTRDGQEVAVRDRRRGGKVGRRLAGWLDRSRSDFLDCFCFPHSFVCLWAYLLVCLCFRVAKVALHTVKGWNPKVVTEQYVMIICLLLYFLFFCFHFFFLLSLFSYHSLSFSHYLLFLFSFFCLFLSSLSSSPWTTSVFVIDTPLAGTNY